MDILEQLLHDSEQMTAYELEKKYSEKISKHDLIRLVKNLNYRYKNLKKNSKKY